MQALLGSTEIARRAESFGVDATELARVELASFTDDQVIAMLVDECSAFLDLSEAPSVVDGGDVFQLSGVEGGSGWCEKATGKCTCKHTDSSPGSGTIEDVAGAVNAALEKLADLELLALGEHDTLDVVSTTVEMPAEDRLTCFGRRHRGVPMLGAELCVLVSKTARVLSYQERWHRITGEQGDPIVLLDLAAIDALRTPDYQCYPVVQVQCGYVEDGLSTPGVGCSIQYQNLDSGDPMSDLVSEWVNLAVGGDPPLFE